MYFSWLKRVVEMVYAGCDRESVLQRYNQITCTKTYPFGWQLCLFKTPWKSLNRHHSYQNVGLNLLDDDKSPYGFKYGGCYSRTHQLTKKWAAFKGGLKGSESLKISEHLLLGISLKKCNPKSMKTKPPT